MCTITANSRNWCCSIKVELPTVCLGLITEAVWANPVLPTYLSYQSCKPDPTNHSTDRIQYKHWKQSALGLVGSGLRDYELITTMCQKMGLPARQTRCFPSATYSICVRAGGYYSLPANAIHTWWAYGVTAIKSRCVIQARFFCSYMWCSFWSSRRSSFLQLFQDR